MEIQFVYSDKLRNVLLNDDGKLLNDETMRYIQGLELDEKTGRRVFKKYIKKNMGNLVSMSYGEKQESVAVSSDRKETDDDFDEMSGKIIEFKYSKSNPDKVRKFEIKQQDQNNYYGYEIETDSKFGLNKQYKVFNKKYVNNLSFVNGRETLKEVREKRKIEEIDEVVTSLKKMAVEPRIGEKISGGYINDSFTIENKSGNFVIQKVLKGNKTFYLKISEKDIKEISNDEYLIWVG